MLITNTDYQGFDQSIPVTKEQAQVMASNGMRFVGRYINGTWKKMKLAESQMLSGMGFKMFSIYETTASMAIGNDGFSHGKAAKELAESLNQPSGTTIYFAVDFDVTKESQYAAIREFLIEVKKGLAGAYKVGIYGEYDLMVWAADNGIAERFFQTYAWSGGKVYSGNHVLQYQNQFNLKGYEIDLCKSNNIADLWSYQKEVKPMEQRITELEENVRTLIGGLTQVSDKLAEISAPDWFIAEFPNALDSINQKSGTAEFWRGIAVVLRILKSK
jgi:cell division protein FtsB